MKICVVPDPNESRWSRFKREVKAKAHNAAEWCNNNKDIVIIVAPIILGGAVKIVASVAKGIAANKMEDVKNLYAYDNRLGHYWALRRELTNNEWLKVEARKRAGEDLGDILDSMRVLK